MKYFVDKKRTHRQFEVRDYVLLKLQPYKQSSLKNSMPQKLAVKFYGPYMLIERIGEVAYRLLLPSEAKIYNVFHISQLKPYHGKSQEVKVAVPTYWENQVRVLEKMIADDQKEQ